MRSDAFCVNGIAQLSTGYSEAYPHSLWKTLVRRSRTQGALPQKANGRLLKHASMRSDAFCVNGIAQLSTGFCSAYPHGLWKTFGTSSCSVALRAMCTWCERTLCATGTRHAADQSNTSASPLLWHQADSPPIHRLLPLTSTLAVENSAKKNSATKALSLVQHAGTRITPRAAPSAGCQAGRPACRAFRGDR